MNDKELLELEVEKLRLENENLKLSKSNKSKSNKSDEGYSFSLIVPLYWYLIPFFIFYMIGMNMISESDRVKTDSELSIQQIKSGELTSLEFLKEIDKKRSKNEK